MRTSDISLMLLVGLALATLLVAGEAAHRPDAAAEYAMLVLALYIVYVLWQITALLYRLVAVLSALYCLFTGIDIDKATDEFRGIIQRAIQIAEEREHWHTKQ